MNYIHHLNAFFSYVKSDKRLTCTHVSLYIALFQFWNYNRFRNPVPVSRNGLMQLSKLGSKNTYHKCIKELHQAGYIFCHPSASKFESVKISIVRLDKSDSTNQPTQLDIFNSDANPNPRNPKTLDPKKSDQKSEHFISHTCPNIDMLPCPKNDTPSCIEIDTGSVLNLIPHCTEFDTGMVSNVGHSIKQNIYKTVNSVCVNTHTPQKNKNSSSFFDGKHSSTNAFENGKHFSIAQQDARMPAPTKNEVEAFFTENKYAVAEAEKFFLYNNGRGWQLTNKTSIADWHSFAHKWMLNEKSNLIKKQQSIYHTDNNKNYSEPL